MNYKKDFKHGIRVMTTNIRLWPVALSLVLILALIPSQSVLADDRLRGYWHDAGEDGEKTFEESDSVRLWLPESGIAAYMERKIDRVGSRAYRYSMVQKNDTLTVTYPDGEKERTTFEFITDDLVRTVHENGDEYFFKRLVPGKHIHAAVLRLFMAGAVETYKKITFSELFGDAELVLVDVLDSDDQVLLAHMPGADLQGRVTRDGTTLAVPMEPGVMAFYVENDTSLKRFEQLIREAAQFDR